MKPSAQSSMVSSGSRCTPGLAKPKRPWFKIFAAHTVGAHGDRVAMCWEGERTWQERCTRRVNLTVDAQWDKMSMTRRNWRVVGESPHAPRWPLLNAKRAVFGVSPVVRPDAGVASSGARGWGVPNRGSGP